MRVDRFLGCHRIVIAIILVLLFVTLLFVACKTDKETIQYKHDVHSIKSEDAKICEELFEIPFWASQAGCYIEDGKYLICYPSSFGDLLVLRCYDRNSKSFIWQKTVEGCGHANSICFRPKDRKLYIADCFDRKRDLVNTISVIEYDNIDRGVVENIVSPGRGGIYSIAYERETDCFYSTNFMGTEEGNANVLFCYGGTFDTVKKEIILDDLSVRNDPHYSSQGVQFIKDGIAYIPYYSPDEIIVGFDVKSGKKTLSKEMPDTIDGYEVTEMQSLCFDYDTFTFMIVDAFGLIEAADASFDQLSFVVDIPFRWATCGCYVENDIYVIAYPSSDGNTLILRGIDATSDTAVWTYETDQVKYANSICFRPADRRLYIADCYTYAQEDEVNNRICILDYDDIEKGVIEEINPHGRGGIYSIAYDFETDTFYSTNFIGNTEGESNVIFEYDGIFESIKREITTDDLTSRNRPSYQSMGVQCVVNNIGYVLYSKPDYVVTGYDMKSGEMVLNYIVPLETTDNSKAVIRPETIIYNKDLEDILVQTATGIVRCK